MANNLHPLGSGYWIRVAIELSQESGNEGLAMAIALAIAKAIETNRSVRGQLQGSLHPFAKIAPKIEVTISYRDANPTVRITQLTQTSKLITNSNSAVQARVRRLLQGAMTDILPELEEARFVYENYREPTPRKRETSPKLRGHRRPAPSQYPDPR